MLREFSKWILDVGDGRLNLPNDGFTEIDIPTDILITDFVDSIDAIVKSTYLDLLDQYGNQYFLQTSAILATTFEGCR